MRSSKFILLVYITLYIICIRNYSTLDHLGTQILFALLQFQNVSLGTPRNDVSGCAPRACKLDVNFILRSF